MESYYGYIYIRIGFCLFGYDPIIIYNVDRFFFFVREPLVLVLTLIFSEFFFGCEFVLGFLKN
jgi:hypothetical protein